MGVGDGLVGGDDILLYRIASVILQIDDVLATGVCNTVVDEQVAVVFFCFGGETHIDRVVGQSVISPDDGVANKDAVRQFFFKVVVDGDASDKSIWNLHGFDDGVVATFEPFANGNVKLTRFDRIGKV